MQKDISPTTKKAYRKDLYSKAKNRTLKKLLHAYNEKDFSNQLISLNETNKIFYRFGSSVYLYMDFLQFLSWLLILQMFIA